MHKDLEQTRQPNGIDAYIATCPPPVQEILTKIRSIIRTVAPQAQEKISYRMPAFTLDGVLVYFAAFKHHIGMYPPVHGDAKLLRALAPYLGEKGNLKFPLDAPMPYALIERFVHRRVQEHGEQRASGRRR